MSTTTNGERPTTSWCGVAMLSTNVATERPPACPVCADTGYVMQDRGTSLYPDWIEVRCRCNPAPTDEEAAAWEDVHDLPVVDYDVPTPWISIGF